ncbi:MAG: nucleotidyl transferase [Rhodospirillales bacterium]|nr:nucleotidyl transferase [Rhodospirillales bacterium]
MTEARDLSGVAVAVLAGGLGTRIRATLGDTPKVLAPVNGRAYLDHLLDRLAVHRPARIVLCLGDRSERVLAHLERHPRRGPAIESLVESAPLGTAGALRHALPRLTTEPVLVMNGDSWIDADLGAFVAAHRKHGAPASIFCARVDDASRFGRVEVDLQGYVVRFVEKDRAGRGAALINAGVYAFSQAVLGRVKTGTGASLEYDVLAKLAPGTLYAHTVRGAAFVDIGTPEGLARAAEVLPKALPENIRRTGAA